MAPGIHRLSTSGAARKGIVDVYRYRDGSPHRDNRARRSHAAQALIQRSCAYALNLLAVPGRAMTGGKMPCQTDMQLVQPRLDDRVQHDGRVVGLAHDVMSAAVAPDAAIERRGEGGAAR